MSAYTLSSYEPVHLVLPKPTVPQELIDKRIEAMLEPFSEYRDVEEDRGVLPDDYLTVTTQGAAINGNPAPYLTMQHALYRLGSGEMPLAFDNELVGMRPGQQKDVSVPLGVSMPLVEGDSELTVCVTVERIHQCVRPELTDEFVSGHFAPLASVSELRRDVASHFRLPDMRKDDPRFPDMVLSELALRLVEEPDAADALEDEPMEALRVACAIDALADHLGIGADEALFEGEIVGDESGERKRLLDQLRSKGMEKEAHDLMRREAALAWLVENSTVAYRA